MQLGNDERRVFAIREYIKTIGTDPYSISESRSVPVIRPELLFYIILVLVTRESILQEDLRDTLKMTVATYSPVKPKNDKLFT